MGLLVIFKDDVYRRVVNDLTADHGPGPEAFAARTLQ
jgi:hypothetical protein